MGLCRFDSGFPDSTEVRCALRDESPCHSFVRKVVVDFILSGLILKELVEFLNLALVKFVPLSLHTSEGSPRRAMKRLKQAMNASDVRSVTNSK